MVVRLQHRPIAGGQIRVQYNAMLLRFARFGSRKRETILAASFVLPNSNLIPQVTAT
jgi:hypothetical protein